MFTILFTVKLLIMAFIISHHDAYGYNSDEEAFIKFYEHHLEIAKATKHPVCFASVTSECNFITSPIPGYDVTRWTYVPPAKVCIPVYMRRNDTCKELDRLPLTIKECEDLCGEPCIITLGKNRIQHGICTLKCRIHVLPRPGIPKPCPYSGKCCNKYFMYSTVSPKQRKTTIKP